MSRFRVAWRYREVVFIMCLCILVRQPGFYTGCLAWTIFCRILHRSQKDELKSSWIFINLWTIVIFFLDRVWM